MIRWVAGSDIKLTPWCTVSNSRPHGPGDWAQIHWYGFETLSNIFMNIKDPTIPLCESIYVNSSNVGQLAVAAGLWRAQFQTIYILFGTVHVIMRKLRYALSKMTVLIQQDLRSITPLGSNHFIRSHELSNINTNSILINSVWCHGQMYFLN